MMRFALIFSLALSLTLLGACKQSETATVNSEARETSAQAKELSPEDLGELGARIEKEPDRAKELLSEQGLDEKSFETRIRRITENPDESKRYATAYEKAKV